MDDCENDTELGSQILINAPLIQSRLTGGLLGSSGGHSSYSCYVGGGSESSRAQQSREDRTRVGRVEGNGRSQGLGEQEEGSTRHIIVCPFG